MTAETTTEERIRARAYRIWEAAGCPEGSHERHWHQAAFEIAAEGAPAVKKVAAPKAKPAAKAPAKKKAA